MPRGTSQCPCSCGEPLLTHASTGADSFGSASCRVTVLLLWVLVSTKFCLCPPRLEFVSLSPLQGLQSNPTVPQGQTPLGCPVPLLDPQAGKPDMGFRIFTIMRELLWYYYSPVCGSPPVGMGFWFDHDCAPFSHLTVASSLSLDVGCLFLVCSSILLSMAVQHLVAILVLTGGDEHTSLYSATFHPLFFEAMFQKK